MRNASSDTQQARLADTPTDYLFYEESASLTAHNASWSALSYLLRRLPVVLSLYTILLTMQVCTGNEADPTQPPDVSGTPVEIESNPPQCFNFASKTDILALRTHLVAMHSHTLLVGASYTPNASVFGELEDNKPWWGMQGEAVWGVGQRSIEGDSEESRFVLNPYVLVAANPYAFGIWHPDRISVQDLERPDFPYTWSPSQIRWWPQSATGQVIYDVSAYNEKLFQWRAKLKEPHIDPRFGLVAYNARDFGFNFLALDIGNSSHVKNLEKQRKPIQIKQHLHCGKSCGYAGGCNNMSPATKAIENIKYTRLPARACIHLWKEQPRSMAERPDFTFYIELK